MRRSQRLERTIRRLRVACWISKAIHAHGHVPGHARTHTQICNAFPQQQWFRERALVLRYTCIACLVIRGFQFQFWDIFKAKTSPNQRACQVTLLCLSLSSWENTVARLVIISWKKTSVADTRAVTRDRANGVYTCVSGMSKCKGHPVICHQRHRGMEGIELQLCQCFDVDARWGEWPTPHPGSLTPGTVVQEAGWVPGTV